MFYVIYQKNLNVVSSTFNFNDIWLIFVLLYRSIATLKADIQLTISQ